MLYFAYGSNMDWSQMRERCPSARFYSKAKLNDRQLAFTRYSKKRNGGVADILESQGNHVWGVIYQIDELDVGRLDVSEGFRPSRPQDKNSYVRTELHVYVDGNEDKPILVTVYVAERQKDPPPPSQEYKRLIVCGARYWHLPEDYVQELEAIRTQ